MSASYLGVTMDATSLNNPLPIHHAILELAGMASEFAEREGIEFDRDENSVAVLVDARLEGARYLLMRMPYSGLHHDGMAPVTAMHSHQQNPEEPRERRQAFGNLRRAMVVDRSGSECQWLQEVLRQWGFDVKTAELGAEAVSAFEDQAIELFIVGSDLPISEGIEFCRQLSTLARDSVPHILMIGPENEGLISTSALSAGATDYLPLPLDESGFRGRLLVATRILERQDILVRARNEYRDQASRDTLTGLWNRGAIFSIFEQELERARRNGRSTGILMVDLDHFKNVNDAHGHLAGDMVLRETGRRLKAMLRSYDSVGRYGGEEFLIVLPNAHEAELKETAERLRQGIEERSYQVGDGVRITISIGAAIAEPRNNAAAEVFSIADGALYKAKKNGRNRVVLEL